MLRLQIPEQELWDPIKERFIDVKGCVLELEHSLESISKWESKWHVPFHSDKEKTYEQNIDYIRCMTLNGEDVDQDVYYHLTEQNVKDILDYITDSNTATWFNDANRQKRFSRDVVTAEIVYYWMAIYNIPESYQRWHFNKLMTLLRVSAEKNNESMSHKNKDTAAQRRALIAARRKRYHTRG